MELLNLSEIQQVYIFGDIHGNFPQFKSEINYRLRPPKKLLFGKKIEKTNNVSTNDNVEPTLFFVAGDCGFGFNKPTYYTQTLKELDETLNKTNSYVVFIRGNHDNPAYFNEDIVKFNNIKLVKDYTVVMTKDNNFLCVGGGISVDRLWRRNQEVLINRYNLGKKKELYWANEAVVYDVDKLNEILANNIKINTVITHTAPSFAYPYNNTKEIEIWLESDNKLEEDLKTERDNLDKLFTWLKDHDMPFSNWFYGHFHHYNSETVKHIIFTCLPNDNAAYSVKEYISTSNVDTYVNTTSIVDEYLNMAQIQEPQQVGIDMPQIRAPRHVDEAIGVDEMDVPALEETIFNPQPIGMRQGNIQEEHLDGEAINVDEMDASALDNRIVIPRPIRRRDR